MEADWEATAAAGTAAAGSDSEGGLVEEGSAAAAERGEEGSVEAERGEEGSVEAGMGLGADSEKAPELRRSRCGRRGAVALRRVPVGAAGAEEKHGRVLRLHAAVQKVAVVGEQPGRRGVVPRQRPEVRSAESRPEVGAAVIIAIAETVICPLELHVEVR